MKRRMLALALICTLMLPGCSALLSRPYVVVSSHPEHPVTGDDPSVTQVKSYPELVNAVLYFVSQHIDHGVVRLTDYRVSLGSVEKDLNAACLEVAQDDPLGAFAVDFIKHDYTRVLTNYEANIYLTYLRTAEQIRGVVNVTGGSAIRKELGQVLLDFREEAALQVAYFTEDEDYIGGLVRQAYYDTPAAALGMPEIAVTLYPDHGSRRIVEIDLTYPDAVEKLRARSDALLESAESAVAPLRLQQYDQALRLELLLPLLPEMLHTTSLPRTDGTAPNTPWDALLGGGADSEGVALALQLLCALLEIDCAVVRGTLDGTPHFWNALLCDTPEQRYVDLSRDLMGVELTAETLVELGYDWDAAPPPPASEETEPPADAAMAEEIQKDGSSPETPAETEAQTAP